MSTLRSMRSCEVRGMLRAAKVSVWRVPDAFYGSLASFAEGCLQLKVVKSLGQRSRSSTLDWYVGSRLDVYALPKTYVCHRAPMRLSQR